MAGGLRFKFSGSKVQVLTGLGVAAGTITAITKANPAVVTQSAHGYVDGDVISISGVVGMTEINGGTYIVNMLTTTTYELAGVDSTGYGTYTSGGTVQLGTFSNICELTAYNRQGGTSPEIDATTICSDAAEFEVGLPDFGTTQLDLNFAPKTTVQTAIKSYYAGIDKGKKTAVRVILPNAGGTLVQLGTIQQASEQAANNGLWTASVTIRNTGSREDFA